MFITMPFIFIITLPTWHAPQERHCNPFSVQTTPWQSLVEQCTSVSSRSDKHCGSVQHHW